MFVTFKLLVALILFIAAALSAFIAYQRWTFPMRVIFGKGRVKKRGTKVLGIYMYVGAVIFVLLGLMILF